MGYGKNDYIAAYVLRAGITTYRLTLWRSANPEWVAYRLSRRLVLGVSRVLVSGTSAERRPDALLRSEILPELRRHGCVWADDLEAAVSRKWPR